METINPATGEVIKSYELMNDARLDTIIQQARAAQRDWDETDFGERAENMKNVAGLLRSSKNELAELMATEMGKPLAAGVSEAEKCAWVCEYYAENAESFLESESIKTDAKESYVAFRPLGTVLAIMPWNFPFWQLFRFAAPALMAGNAAILKHAPNVTGCALRIEQLMHDAGFPPSLFRTVLADIDQTQAMIKHSDIAAVTLTGSTRAGKAVAAQAGNVLKKTVLELGGSDPYLILEDADLERAAETCVVSRLINSGQSCIAAKRFIAVDAIYEPFLEKVKAHMEKQQLGSPFEESTDIGPMARFDLRDELHRQVQESLQQGAECLLGGYIPEGDGAYYPATILTDIKKGMPAYEEELFGPVASVLRAGDENEAIAIANDTPYGLGAAVFSENEEHARRIAERKLQAGCCFINEYVKSDPRLPFGGIKQSGFGRELSHFGIQEFVNIKTVYISG